MTKISLATYTFKLAEKVTKTNDNGAKQVEKKYLKLDQLPLHNLFNFNEGTITSFDLLGEFLNSTEGYANDNKAIITKNHDFIKEKNIITGLIHYGTYGVEIDILKVRHEQLYTEEIVKIKKEDCPVNPYYFYIKIPKGRKEGLIIFEKKGISGLKTIFTKWFKDFIKQKNINLEVDIESFIPEKIIKAYTEKGTLREIRYLYYNLPSDKSEILRGYEPDEGHYEIKYVLKDKSVSIASKIKKLLSGEEIEHIKDPFIDNQVPDDIKFNIALGDNPRTFTVSNPENAAPYRDITEEIKIGDDGHPDFKSIHSLAEEYAEEIFK